LWVSKNEGKKDELRQEEKRSVGDRGDRERSRSGGAVKKYVERGGGGESGTKMPLTKFFGGGKEEGVTIKRICQVHVCKWTRNKGEGGGGGKDEERAGSHNSGQTMGGGNKSIKEMAKKGSSRKINQKKLKLDRG